MSNILRNLIQAFLHRRNIQKTRSQDAATSTLSSVVAEESIWCQYDWTSCCISQIMYNSEVLCNLFYIFFELYRQKKRKKVVLINPPLFFYVTHTHQSEDAQPRIAVTSHVSGRRRGISYQSVSTHTQGRTNSPPLRPLLLSPATYRRLIDLDPLFHLCTFTWCATKSHQSRFEKCTCERGYSITAINDVN